LLLGYYDPNGKVIYAGRAGSGINDATPRTTKAVALISRVLVALQPAAYQPKRGDSRR
jgi:hypothetical protein